MPGYLFGPAIAEEQDLYPDVTFIAVDVTEGDIVNLAGENVALGSNVYICSFQEEQAGYLAGYAAVKDGYTSLGSLAVLQFQQLSVMVSVISRVSTQQLKRWALM